MYELTYAHQGTNTYLVYSVQPGDELDTMTLGMLTNNAIPGLASVTFQQLDTTKYIKFNVTAKVSVSQLFSGPVNKKRLLGVFNGVINAISSAEDYMLDPGMLLLDLDHMYSDVTTCETVLICLPVMNGGHGALELNKFFKNILFTTQFDQTENCDYVAQILNYLNSTPNLSLMDFKKLLDGIAQPKAAPQPMPQPIPQPASQPMPQTAPQQPPVQQSAPAAGWQPVIPQSGPSAYGQPAAPVAPVAPPAKESKKGKKSQSAPTNFAVPGQQPPQAPGNFAVPGQQPPQAPGKQPQPAPGNFAVPGQQPQLAPAASAPGEKPMSWLYLMQHYNKENAAKYKEQQQAKKAEGTAAKSAKEPKGGKKPQPAPGNFAVPGQQPQPAPGNFAVPGQQPQIPQTPAGFPVPGKQPQPAPGGFPVPGQQPKGPQAPGGFAVPSKQPQPQQQAPAGFPVPGKQPPASQAPGGFAVPGKQPQPQQQAPAGFPVPGQQPQFQPAQPPVQQPIQPPVQQPAFNPINFGETTVLGGDDDLGATTVLSAMPEAAKPTPYLLRCKNNERIPLDKPVFRIGKERSYVDYFIADNPAISRSHANIIDRDGTFYVVDTNSTNHTYVNNVMSPSNAETKLSHGDKLTLGNEEFEFKMV